MRTIQIFLISLILGPMLLVTSTHTLESGQYDSLEMEERLLREQATTQYMSTISNDDSLYYGFQVTKMM